MKKLLLILLPVFSFAQQKDTLKSDIFNRSLDVELKKSLFQKDSLGSFKMDVENYKIEALRERRKKEFQNSDEAFRRDQLRNDLLKHGNQKGKSNLNL